MPKLTQVNCDICHKTFNLVGDEAVIELRTFDEFNREVAERETIFACPKCQKRHAVMVEENEEGDEWRGE